MAPGYVPDGVGHGEHRQTEGQRHAHQAYANLGKFCSQDRSTATAQYQPQGADEFRAEPFGQWHVHSPYLSASSSRTVFPGGG